MLLLVKTRLPYSEHKGDTIIDLLRFQLKPCLRWGRHEQPLNVKASQVSSNHFPYFNSLIFFFLVAGSNPSHTFLWLLTRSEAHQITPSHLRGLTIESNNASQDYWLTTSAQDFGLLSWISKLISFNPTLRYRKNYTISCRVGRGEFSQGNSSSMSGTNNPIKRWREV